MGINYLATRLLMLPVVAVGLGLAITLPILAYRKLWEWLNQRMERQSELLLGAGTSPDTKSSGNAGRFVWLAGALLGAWLSQSYTIKPETLKDLFYNFAKVSFGMMVGSFLSLCLGEVCIYLYEREVAKHLKESLDSPRIVQEATHNLDSLKAQAERAAQQVVRKWVLIGSVIGVTFGCIFLYATVYAMDAANYQQGQARASDLLAALETYKNATGKYPAALTDMTPSYLRRIPRPALRYEYQYLSCRQGTGYILYYRLQGMVGKYCGYGDKSQEWQCVDIPHSRFHNSSCDISQP